MRCEGETFPSLQRENKNSKNCHDLGKSNSNEKIQQVEKILFHIGIFLSLLQRDECLTRPHCELKFGLIQKLKLLVYEFSVLEF